MTLRDQSFSGARASERVVGQSWGGTTKAIEETADVYAFLLYNLGVEPQF